MIGGHVVTVFVAEDSTLKGKWHGARSTVPQ